jgi:hypothetical protein
MLLLLLLLLLLLPPRWGLKTIFKYRTTKNYRNPAFLGPRIGDKALIALVGGANMPVGIPCHIILLGMGMSYDKKLLSYELV